MESDYTGAFCWVYYYHMWEAPVYEDLFRMFLKITKPLKYLLVVLVSFGCYNTLSQTQLLINLSEIYSLKILLTICLKPRAMLPPETLKETLSLPRPASGGCRHSLGYGHISAPFSHHLLLCVPNLPLPLLRTHLGWHLGPTQIIQDNFIWRPWT